MKIIKNIFLYLNFSLFIILLISCSKEVSITDKVTISNINTFVTDVDRKNKIKMTSNSMSLVVMSHHIHEDTGLKCIACHHKKKNDSRIKKCVFCHKGLKGTNHLHKFCIKCHKEKKKGPVKCDDCHIEKIRDFLNEEMRKNYSGTLKSGKKFCNEHGKGEVKCNICHHLDSNTENKQKCSECHLGLSRMRIMHLFCKDCHKRKNGQLEENQKEAPIKCQGCHNIPESKIIYKKYKNEYLPKTGHRKSPIKFDHNKHIENYKTECIDCHHKKSNKKCSSCHSNRDKGEIINLKGAFHQQCHDCHRKTSGPKACGRCHVKEELNRDKNK